MSSQLKHRPHPSRGELQVQQGNRRRLESAATLWARADVDADGGFTVAAHGVEAVLAKRQGKLVFALGVKTAVTLRTRSKRKGGRAIREREFVGELQT